MSLLGFPHSYETGAGIWQDGRYVEGAATLGTVIGTVQPMPARENVGFRDAVPGRVDFGRVRVYSRTPLKSPVEGDTRGDIVHYEGGRYEIIKDITHQNRIIPHYKYIAEYRGVIA